MEDAALVVKGLALLPNALLAGAKGPKVLHRLWDSVPEQPEDDSSPVTRAGNFNIKVHLVRHLFQVAADKQTGGFNDSTEAMMMARK